MKRLSFLLIIIALIPIASRPDIPLLTIEQPTRVDFISVMPDAARILTGGGDGIVRLWDTKSGVLLQKIVDPNNTISPLDISKDGDFLAAENQEGIIAIWNIPSGEKVQPLLGAIPSYKAKFFSDSSRIAITHGRGGVGLWDIAEGKEYQRLEELISRGSAPIDISPNDSTLAFGTGSGGSDSRWGKAILWDLESNRQLIVLDDEPTFAVTSVEFSSDGRLLLTGHGPTIAPAEANLWDLATGRRIKRYMHDEHARLGFAAFFYPDEEKIFSATLRSNFISIFDIRTGYEIRKYQFDEGFRAFALSPQGDFFVTASTKVQLWKISFPSNSPTWKQHK